MMSRIGSILALLLLLSGSALAANSTISGTVQNVDGSACANCTVTFNSQVTQVIGGVTYQPLITSTTTDGSGNLTSISLPQGLVTQITVSENGQSFAPYSAIVPFISSVTFDQMNQGITTDPLNVLASLQPPTGPLSMNNQKITNLLCGTSANDAVGFGCDATFNNLTITGGFTQNVSGLAINGRLTDTAITNPSAPTVTPIGTTGASTYVYFIACHDGNGGTTLASSGTTITNGNSTLNGTNYNQVAWTFPTHALNCDVLRGDTGHSTVGGTGLTSSPFNDQTNSVNSYTAPTRNTTADGVFGGLVSAGTGFFPATADLQSAPTDTSVNGIVVNMPIGSSANMYAGYNNGSLSFLVAPNGNLSAHAGTFSDTLQSGPTSAFQVDNSGNITGTTSTLGITGTTSGKVTLKGSTSGSAAISVGASAGTPTTINLPNNSGQNHFVLATDGSGNTNWVNQSAGGFGSAACGGTPVNISSASNTTVAAITGTAPTSGGPYRALVSYFVPLANTTAVNSIECSVSDGSNSMGASEVSLPAGGLNNAAAAVNSVLSPVTYAQSTSQTFTLTCRAFSNGSTPTANAVGVIQGNPCAIQLSYLPSS